jgi:hypothetical protein
MTTTILKVIFKVSFDNTFVKTTKEVTEHITSDVYQNLKSLINFEVLETYQIDDLVANTENSFECSKTIVENSKRFIKDGKFFTKGFNYPVIWLNEDHIISKTGMQKRILEMNNWVENEILRLPKIKNIDYSLIFKK